MRRQLPEPNDGEGRVETGAVQFADDTPGFFLEYHDALTLSATLKAYLDIQQERFARPDEQALLSILIAMEKLMSSQMKGD